MTHLYFKDSAGRVHVVIGFSGVHPVTIVPGVSKHPSPHIELDDRSPYFVTYEDASKYK